MKRCFEITSKLTCLFLMSTPVFAQTASQVSGNASGSQFILGQSLATGAFASAIGSLNAGFFGINNAYLGSPDRALADQVGGGLWVRPSTGSFNTVLTVPTIVGGAGPDLSKTKVFTDYTGVQAGFDLGKYNLGSSGYSVNFGITGGNVDISSVADAGPTPSGQINKVKSSFSVPFIGGYAALAGHGFFIDAALRHDFISGQDNFAGSFLLNSRTSVGETNFSTSGGYHFDVQNLFFVEPSLGLSLSWIDGFQQTASINSVEGGNLTFITRSSNSDLGRATIRVGRDFIFPTFVLEPFVAASVWNEFAPSIKEINVSSTRVDTAEVTREGTWGQFSIGTSVHLIGNPTLNAFVRADIRTGDKVDGDAFTGGLRYQF